MMEEGDNEGSKQIKWRDQRKTDIEQGRKK